jgi:transposase-like protein
VGGRPGYGPGRYLTKWTGMIVDRRMCVGGRTADAFYGDLSDGGRVRMLSDFDSGVWSVSELCRRYGVCRDTFYAWRRRRESGEEGWFIDHSHAPLHRPHATAAELKEAIVLLRRRFAAKLRAERNRIRKLWQS